MHRNAHAYIHTRVCVSVCVLYTEIRWINPLMYSHYKNTYFYATNTQVFIFLIFII